VNLAGIRSVVQAVKSIPVIGNGDIITPQAAQKMFEVTGCAGVSIGRGAFYDPWIFRRTLQHLHRRDHRPLKNSPAAAAENNEPSHAGSYGEISPEPPFAERVRVMSRHLDLMVEVFGEELGCRMFRKVAPWYAKRFGPAAEFNRHVVQIATRAQFNDVLENYLRWRRQFLDENGELKAKFQPAPMVASFMLEPEVALRQHIPVPKGPVEVW
jgi:tRNA-dihydrouridine synthase